MDLPHIVRLARAGETLDDIKACAGKLWLGEGGGEIDKDGLVRRAIDAHWNSRPGADPYWDFLGTRGTCDKCGDAYKFENLAICPNCFKTSCYRHDRTCECGHRALG